MWTTNKRVIKGPEKKTIMNLTSYTGLSSVGPVSTATWASVGALTLKFTFFVVVIGLKWNAYLSSVLNPVDNKFSFYGFFSGSHKWRPKSRDFTLTIFFFFLQNINFYLYGIIFYVCTLPFSFFK